MLLLLLEPIPAAEAPASLAVVAAVVAGAVAGAAVVERPRVQAQARALRCCRHCRRRSARLWRP